MGGATKSCFRRFGYRVGIDVGSLMYRSGRQLKRARLQIFWHIFTHGPADWSCWHCSPFMGFLSNGPYFCFPIGTLWSREPPSCLPSPWTSHAIFFQTSGLSDFKCSSSLYPTHVPLTLYPNPAHFQGPLCHCGDSYGSCFPLSFSRASRVTNFTVCPGFYWF